MPEIKGKTSATAIQELEPLGMEKVCSRDECLTKMARAIAREYYRIKKQGYRSDLTGYECRNSIEIIKAAYGISRRMISRYLRVAMLGEELSDLVDSGEISVKAAVQLSYLSENSQAVVAELVRKGFHVDAGKAEHIRSFCAGIDISTDDVGMLLKAVQGRQGFDRMEDLYLKYGMERYNRKEVKRIVDDALKLFFSKAGKALWY